jgi:hypothetical protein
MADLLPPHASARAAGMEKPIPDYEREMSQTRMRGLARSSPRPSAFPCLEVPDVILNGFEQSGRRASVPQSCYSLGLWLLCRFLGHGLIIKQETG